MFRFTEHRLTTSAVAVTVALTVWVGATRVDDPTDYSLPGVVAAPAVEAYIDELEQPRDEAITTPDVASSVPPGQKPPALLAATPKTSADVLLESLKAGSPEWVGVMTSSGSDAEIDDFALVAGRQPDIVQIAMGWERDVFDQSLLDRIRDRGSVLMISWEPWDNRQKTAPENQPKFALANILAGDFDDYIDDWAAGLAADGKPVLLRFAHEMNGNWYPWDEGVNGNAPGSYVATWKYLQERFDAAGADNVLWVWSPNTAYPGSLPLAGLFPGEEHVDLLGVVGYFGHFARTPTEFPVFDDLFGPTLDLIAELMDGPVLITETGATEEGGFKAGWIEDFLAAVAERDDVPGFIWFDVAKEADWRILSSFEAEAAFVAGLENPAYSAAN